ncbi:MAG: flippase-like domain-containing protein [Candidatus Tectomicrobia bacterium]|uniref:Flippase-like domain-containing protein n=1 Tax=Tectimicrobiota bacterium TaxID=2528274 RepID=A0A932HZ46_UNCTE|nr:flippase-like domain-containing protein [Candidatus Tectomicrobia bacterium]
MAPPEPAPKPRPDRPALLRQAVPLALTLLIFGVIFWRIPFDRFVEALSKADIPPFLLIMACMSTAYFLVDTFVLSRMIRWFHGPIRYRELLPVRAATYIVSIINTQLAQAGLALYIHRRFGTPLVKLAGTVGALILLEVTNLYLFATLGMLSFPGRAPAALLLAPAALAVVWWAVMRAARGGLGPLGRRLGSGELLASFRELRLRQAAAVLALKGSMTLLSVFVHGQALRFFGIEIPFLHLLAFLPVVFFIGALPVTVAHLGTSQAAWIFFFRGQAPEADLLAYSLASHLTFMLANGCFGLVFLPRVYADLFGARRPASPGAP